MALHLRNFIYLGIFLSSFLGSTCAESKDLQALSLLDLEKIALSENKALNSKIALEGKVRAEKKLSLSKWLPDLQGTYYVKKYEHPSTDSDNPEGTYSGSLELTQKIFQLDLIYQNQVDSIKYSIQKLVTDTSRLKLLYDVRVHFFELSYQKEMIDLSLRKIKLLQDTAKEIEGRYKLGAATLYDVNQAKVYISGAEPAYFSAVRRLKQSQDQLKKLIGRRPKERAEFQAASLDPNAKDLKQYLKQREIKGLCNHLNREPKLIHTWYEQWEQVALNRRPDIAILRQKERMAEKEVKKAKAQYAPSLSGFVKVASDETAKMNQQTYDWNLGLELDIPIFKGLGRYRKYQAAKFQKRAQRFDLESGLEQMELEVRDQCHLLDEAMSNFFAAKSSYHLAQEGLDQAKNKYSLGYTTLVEYETAIEALFGAEVNYHKARFELLKAYYGLRFVSAADLNEMKR